MSDRALFYVNCSIRLSAIARDISHVAENVELNDVERRMLEEAAKHIDGAIGALDWARGSVTDPAQGDKSPPWE